MSDFEDPRLLFAAEGGTSLTHGASFRLGISFILLGAVATVRVALLGVALCAYPFRESMP